MKRFVILLAFLLTCSADAFAGKSCGPEFTSGLISRANALESSGRKCDPVLKRFNRKKAAIAELCQACGPLAWHLVYLERYANDYSACFRQTSSGRKVLAKLRRGRHDFKFMQRACGF